MPIKRDEDQAPSECQKQACAIQTCIVKHNYSPDPVQRCQPYFEAYKACAERQNEATDGSVAAAAVASTVPDSSLIMAISTHSKEKAIN